jgi:hypothetical protein
MSECLVDGNPRTNKASILTITPLARTCVKIRQKDCCRICLSEYANGENVKTLPCVHSYHKNCIDKWLKVSLLIIWLYLATTCIVLIIIIIIMMISVWLTGTHELTRQAYLPLHHSPEHVLKLGNVFLF